MRRRLTLILAPLALLLSACGSGQPAHPAVLPPAAPGHMDGHMAGGHHGDGEVANSPVAAGAREIRLLADNFSFDPSEITVRPGEEIAIVLTSVDILHDFVIDELGAHVAAARGETASGGFTAGEPGRYVFYCSVAGHQAAGMEGLLVVEEVAS